MQSFAMFVLKNAMFDKPWVGAGGVEFEETGISTFTKHSLWETLVFQEKIDVY